MIDKIENEIEKFTGWKDETPSRAETFANFYKKYSVDEQIESKTKRRYDSTEFHVSGAGLTTEIRNGEIKPDEVRVYYENGEIKKIHINYREPSSTDIYLSKRALADFLK